MQQPSERRCSGAVGGKDHRGRALAEQHAAAVSVERPYRVGLLLGHPPDHGEHRVGHHVGRGGHHGVGVAQLDQVLGQRQGMAAGAAGVRERDHVRHERQPLRDRRSEVQAGGRNRRAGAGVRLDRREFAQAGADHDDDPAARWQTGLGPGPAHAVGQQIGRGVRAAGHVVATQDAEPLAVPVPHRADAGLAPAQRRERRVPVAEAGADRARAQ
jgi:hypothetical protein